MAGFKFNFQIPHNEGAVTAQVLDDNTVSDCQISTRQACELYPAFPNAFYYHLLTSGQTISVSTPGCTVNYIKLDDINTFSQYSKSNSENLSQLIQYTDNHHSDLLPGIYEGGLKVWECTYDLLDYVSQIDFKGKRVLDLGCGVGLLGIYSLLMGAHEVHFQDYNHEVIQFLTIPNVLLNICKTFKLIDVMSSDFNCTALQKCRFFSGDWESYSVFSGRYTKHKFDIIMTSETIYSAQSHSKLLHVFKELLDINGVILVAAKSHYFGVGGTMKMFLDLIKKEGIFSHCIVKEMSDGIPRVIVELKIL